MPSSLRQKAALPLSKIQERGRRLLCLGQEPRSDDAPSSTPTTPTAAAADPPTRDKTSSRHRTTTTTTTTTRSHPARNPVRQPSPPHHRRPPSPYFLIHPTVCHHAYPVPPATYLALAGRTPALCPHCAIASAPAAGKAAAAAAPAPPQTIPALICGHALTVRAHTAAVVDANPLVFAVAGANLLTRCAQNPAAGYTVGAATEGEGARASRLLAVEVGQAAAAAAAAADGFLVGGAGPVVRANFNREYCVRCLRERYRVALARQEGARRRLGVGVGGGEEARVLAEQERVWRARVGAWRVWLSVLEIEEEMAVEGWEREGGGGGGGRRKRDSGFGEGSAGGRRRGSVGSWSVRSLSVRSLSLRSWRSKNGAGMNERVEEDVVLGKGGKKKVAFDESCKGEDVVGRHHTRFDRKSKWYKKGKYTVRKPLDTSGWALTDEKDIRRWYSPPLGSNASSEEERGLFTKRRWWF